MTHILPKTKPALVAILATLSSSVAVAGESSTDGAAPTLVPLDIFSVPADLEVTLWAQSPQLKNPTNIDVDADGRIWVAEGVNYRYHKDRDPKGDRIVVLEDTDRDGRAGVPNNASSAASGDGAGRARSSPNENGCSRKYR